MRPPSKGEVFLETLFLQLANGIVAGCIYALMGLGLTMLFGVLDVLNFAHGEWYMLGAFFGLVLLSRGVAYLPAVGLVLLIMFLFGMLFERIVFRPFRGKSHNEMAIATLAASVILQNVAILIWTPDPQRMRTSYSLAQVRVGSFVLSQQRLLIMIVAFVMILSLLWLVNRSRIGRAMRACAQNLTAARLMGINVNAVALITSGIAALLVGGAGILIGPCFLVYPEMGIQAITKAFVVVILGGMGYVEGAIFAGLVIGVVEALAIYAGPASFRDIVTYLIMMVCLLVRPSGLAGKYVKEKV